MRHLQACMVWSTDPVPPPQPFPQPFQPWAGGRVGSIVHQTDRYPNIDRGEWRPLFILSPSFAPISLPSSRYSLFSIFGIIFTLYCISCVPMMSLSPTPLIPLFLSPSSPPSLLMYLMSFPSPPLSLPSLLCSFCPPLFRLYLRNAKNQYRNFEIYIPRKGIAGPHSPDFHIPHVSVSDL